MRKIHAKKEYEHYKDEELETEGDNVVDKSTNNPDAANAEPTVAEVKAATLAFHNAKIAALDGSHLAVLAKATARKKLEVTLGGFAESIDDVADGDRAIIEGCGLHATDEPARHEYDDLELSHGEVANEVVARCRKTDEAGAYAWQIFYGLAPPTDEELWKIKKVTLQIEAVLTGLKQGDVCVRYCAVTKDGMQPWSQHRHIFVI